MVWPQVMHNNGATKSERAHSLLTQLLTRGSLKDVASAIVYVAFQVKEGGGMDSITYCSVE